MVDDGGDLGGQLPGGEDLLRIIRCQPLVDHTLELRNQFHVEMLGQLVRTVPVRVVRSHHRSTVSGPSTFVMPKFEPDPIDLVGKRRVVLPEWLGQFYQVSARFGVLFIIEIDQPIILKVETAYPPSAKRMENR